MIAAFRNGILLLLVAPYAVFGPVAALGVRTGRRTRRPSFQRSAVELAADFFASSALNSSSL
jgi:hypothetical protein